MKSFLRYFSWKQNWNHDWKQITNQLVFQIKICKTNESKKIVWRHDIFKHDKNLVKSFVSNHRKINSTEITSQRTKTVIPSFRIYWKWLVQKQLRTNEVFFVSKYEFNRETFLDYVGEVLTSWNVKCINSSVPQKIRLKPSNSRLKNHSYLSVNVVNQTNSKTCQRFCSYFFGLLVTKFLLRACQPIASLVRANQKLEFVLQIKIPLSLRFEGMIQQPFEKPCNEI